MAVNWKTVNTYPVADSQTLTAMDPVKLSSGKVQEDTTDLSTDIIGFATQTISMGVLSTVGQQEYVGVVSEGLIELTGLVEGSGGTYTTAIAVGDTVSMYWDGTTPYAVNNTGGPIGKVVSGSVASSGTAADTTGTITIQIDLANTTSDLGTGVVGTAELASGAVSSAKLAAAACTGAKLGTDVVRGVTASTMSLDQGTYAITATETAKTVDFTATLTSTTGVAIFCQPVTATGTIAVPGSITDTNFVVTGTNSQTGNWLAVIYDQ